MILPISWGSLEPSLKKRFASQDETKSPIFYFESEIEVFIYKETERGNILCASLFIDNITDLISFKQEYLADAIELTEILKDKKTLIIKTE